MTRKKVNLRWIVSDSARRASLKERRLGLVKKVSELSILCGVSASVIIYSPNEREPATWPTPLEVQQNLARFHNISEIERNKKMMDHETYLKEKVSKVEGQLKKQQMKNRVIEVSDLMHYIYQNNGFDALNVNDFHSLMWFAQEKRKEIKRRVDYCQQGPVFLSSLSFAPSSSALLSYAPPTLDQAPKLALDQLAPNIEGNVNGSNYDHHGKSSIEYIKWDQWFSDMMKIIDKMAGSGSKVKIDHMFGLNAPHQPFVPNSYSGNQLGLVDFGNFCGSNGGSQMPLMDYRNYPSYCGGSNGADTTMGLQPYEYFKELMNIDGIDMPMLQPQPLSYIEGNRNIKDFILGLQVDEGFKSVDNSSKINDMSMTLPLSCFEGNGSGNDIAMGLQQFGNVGTNGSGNASSSDMGLPFEFPESNITTSDIGLPYDVTKGCHTSFHP